MIAPLIGAVLMAFAFIAFENWRYDEPIKPWRLRFWKVGLGLKKPY